MSILLNAVTSTGGAIFPLGLPIIPISGDARRDAAQSLREDNWENEGGRIASPSSAIASFLISASDVEALEAQVNAIESTLASDFADGRIGMRYNTYAHRSRVLRQQRVRLGVLRASFQAQEQQS